MSNKIIIIIIERLEDRNCFESTHLEPINLFLLLKVFKPTRTQDHIGLPRELKFLFTFGDLNPSAHTDHIIQCSWHHPSTWQNIKSGNNTYPVPPMTASKVLQRTTILLCMINLVISMDYCSSSEFPKIKVFSPRMQANKPQIQINPNTHFEKSFWPLSKPLNFSSSPSSTIKTNP